VLAPESFDVFVAGRYPALLRSAYLLTGNHHDAEDLVQGALLKAVPKWGRIEGDPEPYVRRIMVNDNISRWRRRRGREVIVEQVPEAGESRSDADTSLTLAAALAALAPRQRTVIVLRYYEDLTEVQTADLMGIAVGTVKSQARDALARLRVIAPDLALQPAG
jgi:RNA polymerase sigma-70 factor (sigma-E family)